MEWQLEPEEVEGDGTAEAQRLVASGRATVELPQVAASVEANETSYLLTIVDAADDDLFDTELVDDIATSFEVTEP